jgi:hypothetical protein
VEIFTQIQTSVAVPAELLVVPDHREAAVERVLHRLRQLIARLCSLQQVLAAVVAPEMEQALLITGPAQ